ncbi:hypothetical protein C3747_9g140 [Trypanosoma cruzi]|uniref:Uncharacterized protein n=2 Tax=Trypanosoma cruzi TaxID=5693 RepID=Q4E4P7_TRYCC|nr:hypothetical protein, conserved [Trypanosoma cruzi]EAN99704.1 hypothetical protein, conserved [Trypanosoma cruzi]PWV19725.1 hypothetical protein C3747_9g140 [Trypanosoma cruzi]RNC59897.1 hypothetical protein TcCL_ESM02459 [Trypanosoma cruzi]|eukprot:XP_821555.1 hypothetical protein [Trypanosoma cruzi strain CL Brener]
MDYVALTPTELTLWKEKAAPTIRKVTNLLLRGGAIGFLEMERNLYIGSEEDGNISRDRRRVNPVLFKSIMNKSGVLLTPDEYRNLRTAYSDEGGFLVDDFIALVCPLKSLGDREAGILRNMCGDIISAVIPTIALADLMHTLEEALLPGDVAACEATPFFASTMTELKMIFTPLRYPKAFVPPQDVMNAFAAILLNSPEAGEPLLKCLATVRLPPAPPSPPPSEMPFFFTGTRTAPWQKRGYEYYTDRDNRDEWIRGREEAPPRPMYQRHLPGYQGHLPTYKSKFGRSFHPIEESVPELSRPKEEQGPVAADRYGPAVELKGSWLTRHNFKLA